MQDNPFAHLLPQQQRQPAAQPTFGDPIVAPAPPSERRAERDQQIQEVRTGQQMAIDAERLRLAQQTEARQAAQDQRTASVQAQGLDATEGERKAAAFLIRALGANTTYESAGVGPRSLIGQAAKDTFPGITNYFTEGERQAAESAQDEFIAASLRQDSGAAIPEEELERQRRIYFPMPGDGPEALEQKRQARIRAITGLEQSSGRLLENTRAEWNKMGLSSLQMALERGASKDEILAIAQRNGLSVDEAALEANLRSRDAGGPVSSFLPPDGPSGGGGGGSPSFGEQFQAGIAQGVGDIVQGVGDTVGMITDPFARVLADALGYDGSQMQSLGTNVREGVGLPQSQDPTVRRVNEFAAGGLVGGLAARAAAPLAQAGTVTQNVLSTVGRTPIRDTVAGAGAGAGSVAGENIGGTPGQVVGALAGGLAGYGGANALMRTAAPRQASEYAQAAGRQGVNMLPADAGGPVARAVTTGTRASPLSVAPVAQAAERQQQQFGQAVQRTAREQGEVVSTQQAGETVRQGAERYTRESSQRGSRMYDRAAQMARGVRAIRPVRTVEAIDAELARLAENPAAEQGTIQALTDFRNRIADGVSIQGLRDARTTLSQGVYDGKLRSGGDQAMWKGILGNVADDIDAGLRSVGRDNAATAFRRADAFWSERVEFIDQALQPIIGREGAKGGEEVLQALEGMARGQRGGNARLSRVMSALSPEEAGNVRATLVDRLGRATPGAQDAQGEAFSAATFLTNWNKMTPQAKASLFPDKATRNNLNDLALIAERSKRGQSMANTSNTGVAVNAANVIGGAGLAAANVPAALAGAGSLLLTGRLMASPGFARILAKSAKLPPQAANRTFREQLGILATREPALQNDINAILQASNDNTRLAAEEGNQQ